MSGAEIVILVGVCIAFAAAVAAIIIRKRKGKSCCDCCDKCTACSMRRHCAENAEHGAEDAGTE